jgi:hypothetical protein
MAGGHRVWALASQLSTEPNPIITTYPGSRVLDALGVTPDESEKIQILLLRGEGILRSTNSESTVAFDLLFQPDRA